MKTANGTFQVDLAPEEGSAGLDRMRIEKRFSGELDGTSRGEMTAWRDDEGTAAYVALERVTGSLGDRSGSFVLAHVGTMGAAGQSLRVTVVPGSGTDGLAGLEGAMDIEIEGGEHRYTLEYRLPGA